MVKCLKPLAIFIALFFIIDFGLEDNFSTTSNFYIHLLTGILLAAVSVWMSRRLHLLFVLLLLMLFIGIIQPANTDQIISADSNIIFLTILSLAGLLIAHYISHILAVIFLTACFTLAIPEEILVESWQMEQQAIVAVIGAFILTPVLNILTTKRTREF
ncbi:hypothetical protein ACQZV8_00875 [Magnetococcales bacterium HHB-1]